MKSKIAFFAICFIVLAVFAYFFFVQSNKPGKNDALATCIANSGAKFYGAFWCPHCQNQKAAFGAASAKLLPYIECSAPNGKDMLPVCTEAGIQSFPTWVFPDGTRATGEQTLEYLAEKTSCTVQ